MMPYVILLSLVVQGFGSASAAGAGADALRAIRAGDAFDAAAQKIGALMLFGGENNKIFLGCLNCLETDRDSIDNPVGKFGSPLSATSIRNSLSRYGGEVGQYSPCNELGTHPPIVVDRNGKYFGEVTLNESRKDRIQSAALLHWLRTEVCK